MGLTHELLSKLFFLSEVEAGGIPSVAVKCVDIRRNTSGEGGLLGLVWGISVLRAGANAISNPPGEYGRKAETQRN